MEDTVKQTYEIDFDARVLASGTVTLFNNDEEWGEIKFTSYAYLAGLMEGLGWAKWVMASDKPETRVILSLLREKYGNDRSD